MGKSNKTVSKRTTHRLLVDLTFSLPCQMAQAVGTLQAILRDTHRVSAAEEGVATAMDSPAALEATSKPVSYLVHQQALDRRNRQEVLTLLRLLAEERAQRGLDMLALSGANAIAKRWDISPTLYEGETTDA